MAQAAVRAAGLSLANLRDAADPGQPVLIERQPWLDAETALQLADPGQDLSRGPIGPLHPVPCGCARTAKDALSLARSAGLLPALWIVDVANTVSSVSAEAIAAENRVPKVEIVARARLPLDDMPETLESTEKMLAKLLAVVEVGKQQLITRGALTTFSIANDVAKYFAIIPALFAATYPVLDQVDILGLETPQSAVLSAVIFNALIIVALIPLALRGVRFRPVSATALLRRNLLVYGLGGIIVPFVGIKIIDVVVAALGVN